MEKNHTGEICPKVDENKAIQEKYAQSKWKDNVFCLNRPKVGEKDILYRCSMPNVDEKMLYAGEIWSNLKENDHLTGKVRKR